MKKPVVDYREFRLSRLNEPRFSHLKLLGGWLVYLAAYLLTEKLISAESCHPVHCRIDDIIPFHEAFVIPYVSWYLLIIFSLGYFALYNIDSFRRLSKFIMLTQIVAVAVCIIYPTRQDLRPDVFPRDNFLSDCVGLLYSLDTSTGVCPSLHVAISIGIGSVWCKEKGVHPVWKTAIVILVVLICLSTMFIKQHSAVDFFAALPVCLLAELVVYRDRYLGRILKGSK